MVQVFYLNPASCILAIQQHFPEQEEEERNKQQEKEDKGERTRERQFQTSHPGTPIRLIIFSLMVLHKLQLAQGSAPAQINGHKGDQRTVVDSTFRFRLFWSPVLDAGGNTPDWGLQGTLGGGWVCLMLDTVTCNVPTTGQT